MRVFWVGKTREPFIREGLDRYRRLISPWLNIETIDIRQERSGGAGPSVVAVREGERILQQTDRFVLLDAAGEDMTSETFARRIRDYRESGPFDWVIGGAYGVSPDVRAAAVVRLSLSRMTFTHEMVRLILLEQIYRALTIIHGKKYHY